MTDSYTIDLMKPEDIDIMVDNICPHYIDEGNKRGMYQGLTPDLIIIRSTVELYLNYLTLVAKIDGRPVGVLVARVGRSFFQELECDIEMFYLVPEARGTGISRNLIEKIIDLGKSLGVKLFYTSCLSGMGQENEKLFVNLWSKFGFKMLGVVMIRVGE